MGVIAAKAGWGKSYYLQAWIEENIDDYDRFVALDFKDEYRGLVKAGLATQFIVGPREAEAFGVDEWKQFLQANPKVVLVRHKLDAETWREEVAAPVAKATRELPGSSLTALDESHFLAPQTGKVPPAVKGLATTGRGEGASSLWVTQRLSEMDETVNSQANFTILGGFTSTGDLSKVGDLVDYPKELHNPNRDLVSAPLDDSLCVDGEALPVRKFTDGDQTVGSEWVYADEYGSVERRDTREVSMQSTHYGAQGEPLRAPGES